MAKKTPLPNGDDPWKRDARGRFGKDNRGGPGNPLGGMVNDLRRKFLVRIRKRRGVQKSVDVLLAALDDGNKLTASQVIAIRELLDRAGIKDIPANLIDERRVEADERLADQLEELDGE